MAISALRTIKPPVARRGMAFGVGETARWPTAQLGLNLDYSIDISTDLADVDDTITAVSIAIAPSGGDELQASSVFAQDGVVTAVLNGGVAGRQYTCRLLVTCLSGRVLPYTIGILVNPALATFPLTAPQSAAFGTAVQAVVPIFLITEDGNYLADEANEKLRGEN
jgi:hypothetical protein